MREYHGKTQSHLQIIYRHEIENARALAKLETDESNVCLERERCFSSTKRLLGGVVEIFEESGDESDADGENGGTLKCRNIYFFVDDDDTCNPIAAPMGPFPITTTSNAVPDGGGSVRLSLTIASPQEILLLLMMVVVFLPRASVAPSFCGNGVSAR